MLVFAFVRTLKTEGCVLARHLEWNERVVRVASERCLPVDRPARRDVDNEGSRMPWFLLLVDQQGWTERHRRQGEDDEHRQSITRKSQRRLVDGFVDGLPRELRSLTLASSSSSSSSSSMLPASSRRSSSKHSTRCEEAEERVVFTAARRRRFSIATSRASTPARLRS